MVLIGTGESQRNLSFHRYFPIKARFVMLNHIEQMFEIKCFHNTTSLQ